MPIDISMRIMLLLRPLGLSSRLEDRSCEYLMVYCWKCGSELREDAGFCPKCGASVRGTMGVQSPTGFELLRDDKTVQNHWARRLIALIIDAAIVTVALVIIAVVVSIPFLVGLSFSSTTVGAFPAAWGAWWGFWFGGVGSIVILLYFFLAEGLYGRTLGKEIMGLRVQRVDGKPMDMRSSFIRNISKIYWVLLLIDVAVGLGTHGEMSQKWSDRYIGTRVEEKTRMTIIP
jgi:uncharacterized RDD family membrane protein YckC